MNKKHVQQIIAVAILASLCAGCGVKNTAGDNIDTVSGGAANTTGAAAWSTPKESGKKKVRYVAEAPEYGLALPEADVFGEELEDMIYWSHAKRIEQGDDRIYGYLKEKKVLGKELKIKLSYAKDRELEMFNDLCEYRPLYLVRLTIPELGGDTIFYLEYYASGLASCLDSYNEEEDDEEEEEDDEVYNWHELGVTTICIEEEKAETYTPQETMTEKKEQIIKDLQKKIATYKRKDQNCAIYLQDFLPGDSYLTGVILNYDIGKEPTSSVDDLTVVVYYTNQNEYYDMEWHPRGTMFNSERYSQEGAEKMLKEREESILVDRCLMAYRIKGEEMTSLK